MERFLVAAAALTLLAGQAFADPANAPGLKWNWGIAPADNSADPQGPVHNEHAAEGSVASIRG